MGTCEDGLFCALPASPFPAPLAERCLARARAKAALAAAWLHGGGEPLLAPHRCQAAYKRQGRPLPLPATQQPLTRPLAPLAHCPAPALAGRDRGLAGPPGRFARSHNPFSASPGAWQGPPGPRAALGCGCGRSRPWPAPHTTPDRACAWMRAQPHPPFAPPHVHLACAPCMCTLHGRLAWAPCMGALHLHPVLAFRLRPPTCVPAGKSEIRPPRMSLRTNPRTNPRARARRAAPAPAMWARARAPRAL